MPELPAAEVFFDDFAATITPFAIALTRLDVQAQADAAQARVVLWVEARETPYLRALHERLNAKSAWQFGDRAAPFDGAALSLPRHGGDRHRGARDASPDARRLRCATPRHTYMARELAMLYYDEGMGAPATYITYKIALVSLRAAPA